MLPAHLNFRITIPGTYAQAFRAFGVTDFSGAIELVRGLAYARISDSNQPLLVLQEKRGTCSSKHNLLARLAHEQGHTEVEFMEMIFEMNSRNTPAIASVLNNYNLAYIPELHNYLRIKQFTIDATSSQLTINYTSCQRETYSISPDRTAEDKVKAHKNYLRHWQSSCPDASHYTLDELWGIREACIAALSNTQKRIYTL